MGYQLRGYGHAWLDDSAGYSEASLYDGTTYTTINLVGSYDFAVHSMNNNGEVVYVWVDGNGNYHSGMLSGGSYYLLDIPGATNMHADGINDSGIISGRYNPIGATTVFNGFTGPL